MRQLSTLSGWPPQGGAGPFDSRKKDFASSPELVTLRRVNRISGRSPGLNLHFRQGSRDLPIRRGK
jgi:hypothetical protein